MAKTVEFAENSVRYPDRQSPAKATRYSAIKSARSTTRKSPTQDKSRESSRSPTNEEKSPRNNKEKSPINNKEKSPINNKEKSPRNNKEKSPHSGDNSPKKMSADKVLFEAFKTKSCKEIREELMGTRMTEEEQVHFIEQHYTSSRGLQSYIQKQHYNAQDLKFMSQAGSDFCTIIQHKAYDLYNGMIDPSDAGDADCVFLKDKMNQFYTDKEAAANSKWAKIMKISKQVLSSTYELGKSAASAISYGLSWAASKGFQLWTWISTNPKTAYFALMTLKSFKTQLCRMGGQYLASAGVILDDRESILAFIKKVYPDVEPPPPNSKLGDMLAICKDGAAPIMTEIIGKSAGSIFGKLAENTGPILSKALGGAVKGIPFVGPMLGGAIEAITETVFKEAADQAAFMAEQATYQSQVNNCFTMLKDIVNPFSCLEEMAKEAYKIVKPLVPVKAEPGLIKAANEAAKPEKELLQIEAPKTIKGGFFRRRARPSVKRMR
jgi:hypothetical protein